MIDLKDYLVDTNTLNNLNEINKQKFEEAFIAFIFYMIKCNNNTYGLRNYSLNFSKFSSDYFLKSFLNFCTKEEFFPPANLTKEYTNDACAKFKKVFEENMELFKNRGFEVAKRRYREDEKDYYEVVFSW